MTLSKRTYDDYTSYSIVYTQDEGYESLINLTFGFRTEMLHTAQVSMIVLDTYILGINTGICIKWCIMMAIHVII